jgi:hypothetical protein
MTKSKKFGCWFAAILGPVAAAMGTSFAVGHAVTSSPWAGAPKTSEIQRLIETEWMKNPPPDEASYRTRYHTGGEGSVYDPIDEGGGPAVSTKVRDQKIGQARWGRDQSGHTFTYWPVIVSMRTKHRWSEQTSIPPGQTKSEMFRDLELEIQKQRSAVRPTQETIVTIRDCTSKCFAIRIEGVWTITFEEPIDETPFFKFW